MRRMPLLLALVLGSAVLATSAPALAESPSPSPSPSPSASASASASPSSSPGASTSPSASPSASAGDRARDEASDEVTVSGHFDPATAPDQSIVTLTVTATRVSGQDAGEIHVNLMGVPLYYIDASDGCSYFDGIPEDEPYWVTCPLPAGQTTVTYQVRLEFYLGGFAQTPYSDSEDVAALVDDQQVGDTLVPYTILAADASASPSPTASTGTGTTPSGVPSVSPVADDGGLPVTGTPLLAFGAAAVALLAAGCVVVVLARRWRT